MTSTPPDAPSADSSTTGHEGPRVTGSQARDLSRLRRTVGAQRYLGGVAGGLARHFDVDPILIRVAFVVLTLFGGAGLIVYVGCWLLLPEDGVDRAPLQLDDKVRDIALLALAGSGVVLVLGQTFGDGIGWPMALAAVVIGIVLLLTRNDRPRQQMAPWQAPAASAETGAGPQPDYPPGSADPTAVLPIQQSGAACTPPMAPNRMPTPRPPDPRKRGPVLFWMTVATVVLGWGVLGMVDVSGADVAPTAYAALAVALTGAALVLSSVWGRGGGLIALGLAASLGLAATAGAGVVDSDPVTVTPERIGGSYSWGAGTYTVDLTDATANPRRQSHLSAELGVGELTVIVPEDVDVVVNAEVGLGDVTVFGSRQGGPGISYSAERSGEGRPLQIDARVGVGNLEIVSEGDL